MGSRIEFKYNADGLRVQKKVTDGNTVTTTDYFLHGALLVHMLVTGKTSVNTEEETITKYLMHFFYNAEGRPQMVQYTYGAGANTVTATYTYTHNLQGDITGMVDSAGDAVVSYSYDAWGKPTGTSTLTSEYDELTSMNPFRYRGYVWDEETGLYYLRSRYYRPEWGRFVIADQIILDSELLQNNLISYCTNNPISYIDDDGKRRRKNTFYLDSDDTYCAIIRVYIPAEDDHSWNSGHWELAVESTKSMMRIYNIESSSFTFSYESIGGGKGKWFVYDDSHKDHYQNEHSGYSIYELRIHIDYSYVLSMFSHFMQYLVSDKKKNIVASSKKKSKYAVEIINGIGKNCFSAMYHVCKSSLKIESIFSPIYDKNETNYRRYYVTNSITNTFITQPGSIFKKVK